jgi:hypothetical protein
VHTMQAGLGLGTSLGRSLWDVSWVLNAYAVTLAALLLPAGVHGPDRAVQDRFGRLRVCPPDLAVLEVRHADGAFLSVIDVSAVGAMLVRPDIAAVVGQTTRLRVRGSAIAPVGQSMGDEAHGTSRAARTRRRSHAGSNGAQRTRPRSRRTPWPRLLARDPPSKARTATR